MSSQLLIVAFTFLATFLGLGAVGVAYSGTAAVATSLGAVFATRYRRALPWASIGLAAPSGAGTFALQVLTALLGGWGAALLAMNVAIQGLGWAPLDASRFAGIEGNTTALMGALALSWTTAAFGEEVLFRGFVQSRLQALMDGRRYAAPAAAIVQALLFAFGHAYQGATGMLVSGAIGLAFGLLMLRFRNVWPLVIAHGMIDTVSMLALYSGAQPG